MRQLTLALSMAAGLLIGLDGSWQIVNAQPQEKGPPAGNARGSGPSGPKQAAPSPGPRQAAPRESGPRQAAPREVAPRQVAPRDAVRRDVAPTRERTKDVVRDRDGTRTIVRDRDGSRTIVRDRNRIDGSRTIVRDRNRDGTRVIVRDGDRRVVVRSGVRADRHHRRWRSGRWYWVIAPSIDIGDHLGWCHYHRWAEIGRPHRSVRCHRHGWWDHRSIRYVAGY